MISETLFSEHRLKLSDNHSSTRSLLLFSLKFVKAKIRLALAYLKQKY